ncbi:penicillin acylase family protein [Poritiphilus flavus]|uniref:Penicillin acylase family protein n=1 Tax=Poritiphilus flavus TaxID=2697053 RepID=A0A6L9EEH8_9FLAO|nr:penicillin acylase family protein [Poritiphilus flavus]NAS13063.1 penicillin acylase family protein [Poritiphilus flavus]
MKKLKRFGLVLLALLLLLVIATVVLFLKLKPDYDGTESMANLSGAVEVYFDPHGIPHIYAQNEEDAFRTLGYVHAQDRLWQMELLRRVARGGLSEVFGKDLIQTDKFFLALGIDENSNKAVGLLSPDSETAILSQAYLDGINEFIANGPTPVEFYLTGLEKTEFTLVDVYNAMGYMAFSFAMAHKTDPLLTEIREKLGPDYLKDLGIDIGPELERIPNHKPRLTDSTLNLLSAVTDRAMEKLPVPQFIGSNSWVLGPEKTANGKVILANDPHIGFAQPSVWYEAHLVTPDFEKYGYHMAGIPFPILAHDRNLAFGMTMFQNDDLNFYYEQQNPNDSTKYRSPDGWKEYETLSRQIVVKDSGSVTFTYRKTAHGPLMNGIAAELKESDPVSMSWMYTKGENKLLEALYGMSHADDLESFRINLPNVHAPGLNIMYGDANGNIGWFATAKLYLMPDGTHTKFILDGSSTKDEPLRYLDNSENPRAINPRSHYVYSANNQPDSITGGLYPGYYLPEDRAKRIVQLLDSTDNWDLRQVSEMMLDVTSSVSPEVVKNLAKSVDVKQLSDDQIKKLDRLSAWNGDFPLNSIAASVYQRWISFLLRDIFMDELGEEGFNQLLRTHLYKRLIASMAKMENSIWWDDVNSEDSVETRKDIITRSLVRAIESLEMEFGEDGASWTWDKLHTLEHNHPIGRVEALRSFFNVGPFPIEGTRGVINNMSFTDNTEGGYNVSSGPSTRRIIDFSDIENSVSILPTGQSGNPFSRYYQDQAVLYNKGEFRKMLMNKEEIVETSNSLLIFNPRD